MQVMTLLPEELILKAAQMIKDNGPNNVHICPGGNVLAYKRIKHPESGEPYIEVSSDVDEIEIPEGYTDKDLFLRDFQELLVEHEIYLAVIGILIKQEEGLCTFGQTLIRRPAKDKKEKAFRDNICKQLNDLVANLAKMEGIE